ncbi:MAG: multidrug efflux RND transporter permease subunit [Deltaproteobacteria bacterium]|nr:multidrug efflux RND transporter permease subunit [Deltaproteobacteria bacterium]MBW2047978.1 multidrug efflux RND transporter permease subunit [Deltaproteobacteria bacterium]
MFVDFFIDRPIFAGVISIVISLAGAVCILLLPIAQFPEITPPTVQVNATYTGANAEVVEKTVTTPIEEQINGVEGMIYMSSISSNDGSSNITVTFDVGYDLDIAAVDVQNRVSMAQPQVPEEVRKYGITTKKQSPNFVMIISLYSPDRSLDELFLSNYASINIVDILKRLTGVGDVQIFGEKKYSMRLWLNPDKLTSMDMTAMDVISAVQEQNIQVAAGKIGDPPSPPGQTFTYSIATLGRLSTPRQFEEIIVRTRADGSVVRIKDVGRVELGAENYGWFGHLNGGKAALIGVFQLPGANALNVAEEVYANMERLSKRFPEGLKYAISYDTTLFVRESIKEVVMTLGEAMILVFMVVYIFLQNWRATMIPAIAIPVSLIGTFAVLKAFGFSINTLTLFGLVLAIGIVVDDAIIVVENVSRCIDEKGMEPKEATKEAMREVTGPIVATTLVLMAVFVPVAFMPGITGQLYRQFALTIAFSVGISAINALTLSPALCAALLRKAPEKQNWFFRKFNQAFEWTRNQYLKGARWFIRAWVVVLLVFLGMVGATYYMFKIVPTGFVPTEDQGYFMVMIQSPEGASLYRTGKVCTRVEKALEDTPGVKDVVMIGGYNLLNSAMDPSSAAAFVMLNPWDERRTPELSLNGIMGALMARVGDINEAVIIPFPPPPIQGLSTTGGFEFELQDLTGGSLIDLRAMAERLMEAGRRKPALTPLSTTFEVNYPQFYVDLDRTKAKSLQVSISDVFTTLQTFLGSIYVNDFNKFGRIYRVFIQAEDTFRAKREDIAKLYVRARDGSMVPLSALVTVKQIRGVQSIKHYNLFRTVSLYGANNPGYSSGDAISAMEALAAKELPNQYGYEWTGTAYQEIEAGGLAPYIFSLALVFVFLFLAAQYESWVMPLMVMLAVPLAMLGALLAQHLRGIVNDVYCQIGLVMLIGLASKNAILIVEFARELRNQGMSIKDAAIQASRERLRPILMTAFAFILGVVPMVVATGAGAASRHSLGTAVFGGMLASTLLSLMLVPVLYVVLQRLREWGSRGRSGEDISGDLREQPDRG